MHLAGLPHTLHMPFERDSQFMWDVSDFRAVRFFSVPFSRHTIFRFVHLLVCSTKHYECCRMVAFAHGHNMSTEDWTSHSACRELPPLIQSRDVPLQIPNCVVYIYVDIYIDAKAWALLALSVASESGYFLQTWQASPCCAGDQTAAFCKRLGRPFPCELLTADQWWSMQLGCIQ